MIHIADLLFSDKVYSGIVSIPGSLAPIETPWQDFKSATSNKEKINFEAMLKILNAS